jgi:hypothetical protein
MCFITDPAVMHLSFWIAHELCLPFLTVSPVESVGGLHPHWGSHKKIENTRRILVEKSLAKAAVRRA